MLFFFSKCSGKLAVLPTLPFSCAWYGIIEPYPGTIDRQTLSWDYNNNPASANMMCNDGHTLASQVPIFTNGQLLYAAASTM